jgi:hypothetical protein
VANPKEKAQIAKKLRRDDAKTEKSRSMEVSTTTSLFWSELGVAIGGLPPSFESEVAFTLQPKLQQRKKQAFLVPPP